MIFHVGIILGLLFGLVLGICLIAVAMTTGYQIWFTPEVIGPTIGAFLAAIIGFSSAAWVHQAGQQSRKNEHRQRAINATGKVFATTIELYAGSSLVLRQFKQIAERGTIRPFHYQAFSEYLSGIALDLKKKAEHDDLNTRVSVLSSILAKGYLQRGTDFTFDDDFLEGLGPEDNKLVPEEMRKYVTDAMPLFEGLHRQVYECLSEWNAHYQFNDGIDDLDESLEETIQAASQLTTAFSFT